MLEPQLSKLAAAIKHIRTQTLASAMKATATRSELDRQRRNSDARLAGEDMDPPHEHSAVLLAARDVELGAFRKTRDVLCRIVSPTARDVKPGGPRSCVEARSVPHRPSGAPGLLAAIARHAVRSEWATSLWRFHGVRH